MLTNVAFEFRIFTFDICVLHINCVCVFVVSDFWHLLFFEACFFVDVVVLIFIWVCVQCPALAEVLSC